MTIFRRKLNSQTLNHTNGWKNRFKRKWKRKLKRNKKSTILKNSKRFHFLKYYKSLSIIRENMRYWCFTEMKMRNLGDESLSSVLLSLRLNSMITKY